MIPWTGSQRERISEVLHRYPAGSNRCASAARRILPVAGELAPAACALVIRPEGFAIYVQPKNLRVRWAHHVTVDVVEHCVDVLTGVDGHSSRTYLAEYFDHPEAHSLRPVADDEWDLL